MFFSYDNKKKSYCFEHNIAVRTDNCSVLLLALSLSFLRVIYTFSVFFLSHCPIVCFCFSLLGENCLNTRSTTTKFFQLSQFFSQAPAVALVHWLFVFAA